MEGHAFTNSFNISLNFKQGSVCVIPLSITLNWLVARLAYTITKPGKPNHNYVPIKIVQISETEVNGAIKLKNSYFQILEILMSYI